MLSWFEVFFRKYFVVISVSYNIFRYPHSFGESISNENLSLKNSLIYFSEMHFIVLIILGVTAKLSLPPILPEALILIYSIYVIFYTFTYLLLLRLFSKKSIFYRKSLAAFFYSAGLSSLIFLIMPILDDVTSYKIIDIILLFLLIYILYIYAVCTFIWIKNINYCSSSVVIGTIITWYISFSIIMATLSIQIS